MSKIFNVDSLAKEEREIVLKGVKHPVIEMSVDAYLQTMEIAKGLDKPENKDNQSAQINAVISTIILGIPTLDAQTLRNLPFEQMNAIAQFVRGEIPDELKDAITVEVETDEVNSSKNELLAVPN